MLGAKISEIHSWYEYSIYYPEDMFVELILGHQKKDLLSLENLLANSVNVVVILLQSAGTIAELGAFTNHKKLRDKLIVVVDPKHKRSKSFINFGPLRYLKDKTESKIIFLEMNNSNLTLLVKRLLVNARTIAKHSSSISDLSNPILAYKFYLALIYVFDPIPKTAVIEIARKLSSESDENTATAAETVVNSLINERKVYLSEGNLSTTPKGVESLIHDAQTKKRERIIQLFLTELRLKALNLTLRKKNYKSNKIWGEVLGA